MIGRQEVRRPGAATETFTRRLDGEELRRYASALKLRSQLYYSREAAQAAGFKDVVAPISFLLAFSVVPRSVKLGHFAVDESKSVAGDFSFDLRRLACAGDVLTARCVLEKVVPKRSGRRGTILSFLTPMYAADGELVITCRDAVIELEAT